MTKQQMEMLVKLGVSKEEIAKLIIANGKPAKTASSKPAPVWSVRASENGRKKPQFFYGEKFICTMNGDQIDSFTPALLKEAKKIWTANTK